METLAIEIQRGIYTHRFVKRNEHVAIYETLIDDEIIGYEVFLIRKQTAKTVFRGGKSFMLKEKELFPTNEMFGYDAFAPGTLERAEEHFDKLTARVEMRRRNISMN